MTIKVALVGAGAFGIRIARVEAAMPGSMAAVRHWQGMANVGVEGLTLVGFSQGAIMALEAT